MNKTLCQLESVTLKFSREENRF